jgi:hypothetical protein
MGVLCTDGRGPAAIVPLVIAALVALGATPGAARAAPDTTIDFDDLPAGTTVSDQYASRGVEFGRARPGGLAGKLPSTRAVQPGHPGSGNELALFEACGEFCDFDSNFLAAKFSAGHSRVSVLVTNPVASTAPNGHPPPPVLSGFDSDGHRIAQVSGSAPGQTLTISTPGPDIAYIELEGLRAIDDLGFDNPTNLPPDFSLVPRFDPTDDPQTVTVVAGETATLPIAVGRFNGSTGPLNLHVEGLPAHVTAPGLPADVDPSDGKTVDVHLAAEKTSPAVEGAVTVVATPSPAAGTQPHSTQFKVRVRERPDLRLIGMEVTQGIQAEFVNCFDADSCGANASLPFVKANTSNRTLPYGPPMVSLVRGKRTIVRVFANIARATDTFGFGEPSVAGASVRLVARGADGKILPGSPLVPEGYTSPLTLGPLYVTYVERSSPFAPYTFTLPPQWTERGPLKLTATLIPPGESFNVPECPELECSVNNGLTLTGVAFSRSTSVGVLPLRADVPGHEPGSPAGPYQGAVRIAPVADGDFHTPLQWAGTVQAGDIFLQTKPDDDDAAADLGVGRELGLEKTAKVIDRVDEWLDDRDSPENLRHCCGELIAAVGSGDTVANSGNGLGPGATRHGGGILGQFNDDDEDYPTAFVSFLQPFKSTAHETYHELGLKHASSACGAGGTAEHPQQYENWPIDQRGYMQGIGIDPTPLPPAPPGSKQPAPAYRVLAAKDFGAGFSGSPFAPGQPGQWFDLMGYCAGEKSSWISPRHWQEVLSQLQQYANAIHRPLHPLRVARAAAVAVLHVTAHVGPTGNVRIALVDPTTGTPSPSVPNAQYTLVTRDAAGRVLTQTGLELGETEVHSDPRAELRADVAAASVARVEVVRAGAVVAARTRSAHAPTISILAPRPGQRVGRRATVDVRWRAADADRDATTVVIAYSADDGRSWRPLSIGPGGPGHVRLPSRLLAPRATARERLGRLPGHSCRLGTLRRGGARTAGRDLLARAGADRAR